MSSTFVVPTPTVPEDDQGEPHYGTSAWVGIDGYTCDNAVLQAGVDFTLFGSQAVYAGQ